MSLALALFVVGSARICVNTPVTMTAAAPSLGGGCSVPVNSWTNISSGSVFRALGLLNTLGLKDHPRSGHVGLIDLTICCVINKPAWHFSSFKENPLSSTIFSFGFSSFLKSCWHWLLICIYKERSSFRGRPCMTTLPRRVALVRRDSVWEAASQ